MVALVRQNSVQQLEQSQEQSTQLTTLWWLAQLTLSLPPQHSAQTLLLSFQGFSSPGSTGQ